MHLQKCETSQSEDISCCADFQWEMHLQRCETSQSGYRLLSYPTVMFRWTCNNTRKRKKKAEEGEKEENAPLSPLSPPPPSNAYPYTHTHMPQSCSITSCVCEFGCRMCVCMLNVTLRLRLVGVWWNERLDYEGVYNAHVILKTCKRPPTGL